MGLSCSIIDSYALNDTRNYSADDFKSLLITTHIEAHICPSFHLHLNQHDRLVWLLKLEDRCTAMASLKYLQFHNVGHVFETKVDLEGLLLDVFRDKGVEVLMSMGHMLKLASFLTDQINRLLALEEEIDFDDLEDFTH